MALSDELLGFTSPILDRAVKTGGWGVTTKKDDPSVVSDALFKKAQLDLGIADLQMNAGMHEMDSRNAMAMHALDQNITLQDMLNKERQNHVGFFEALVTDLAGAAEGAVTGFAVGGPVGAVVGGAAGFGVTAASQAESGRRGGQGAMSALGTIAGAATTIKGFADGAKAKDSWTSILQTAGGIVGKMNSGSPSERAGAQQEWGQLLNNATQAQISAGVNPEQAFKATKSFGDSMLSGAGDGNTSMLNRYNDFAGIANPTREDFKKFWGDQSMNYSQANKGKEPSDDFLVSQVEGAHPGLMNAMGYGSKSADRQRPVIPEQGGPAADPTQHALPIERPQSAPRTAPAPLEIEALDNQGNVINPTRGRAIEQPAPSQTGSVQSRMQSSFPTPQISRPGLQMEAPAAPAAAEQALSRQGAETVKVLQQAQQPLEQEGVVDKLSKITPWTHTDVADRNIQKERGNAKLQDEIDAQKGHTEEMQGAAKQVDQEQVITDVRQQRMVQEREALNPGVKGKREEQVQKLSDASARVEHMPEKNMAQQNEKKGLQDAVEATQHLSELQETMPEGLMVRFTEFAKQNGIGIHSPHISVESLDEVGKAMADKTFKEKFTPQERDILDEYRMELYNLAYGDALMDAGPHGVKNEQLKMSKPQMPGFEDDYRTRSNKLTLLARGYEERIRDRTKGLESEGSSGDDLDLQYKQMRNDSLRQSMNQRAMKAQQAPVKKKHWLDITR